MFVTGAPNVTIAGSRDLGAALYRARFKGAVPSARVRDGMITIRFPRLAWFDWRARVAGEWVNASAHWKRNQTDLHLNATLPWSIELRGGATQLRADLRALTVSSFEVAGGAGSMSLRLGLPAGRVPIVLGGGAGDITVVRPPGVALRLRVKGTYRNATLDGVEVWNQGEIATPDADTGADRFDVEIAGGVNTVTVRVDDR